MLRKILLLLSGLFLFVPVEQINAQQKVRSTPDSYILPQRRVIWNTPPATRQPVEITKVSASVTIKENRAETRMTISVKNLGSLPTEAELLLPVPADAVFKGFSYGEKAGQYPARLLPAEEARRLYDSIVAQAKDPALMEFAGYGTIKTSVFPIAAKAVVKLELIYEQVLAPAVGAFRYVLPRSVAADQKTDWDIRVEVEGGQLEKILCPTHKTQINTLDSGKKVIRLDKSNPVNAGDFRLLWQDKSRQGEGMYAYACPDKNNPDTGYFMLLYNADSSAPETGDRKKLPRELTLVLDRSGSMRGEKMEQVKKATVQIIQSLDEGEYFNIISYNEGVDPFSPAPVAKNSKSAGEAVEWLSSILPRGGTNISGALEAALKQPLVEETFPVVLFLTDGLPTIGETAEEKILKILESQNKGNRRIFTLGVGVDLNAPLLSRMAETTRAFPTFILPHNDTKQEVEELFWKLGTPLLADPELVVTDLEKKLAPGRVRDMLPRVLPDVFKGSQLMILGQYVGEKPIHIELKGKSPSGEKSMEYVFDPAKTASIQDDFVPRIWAMRKVASLQAELQKLGADTSKRHLLAQDPKTREILEEMINLATEFGIMTEFTSFFADDGSSGRGGLRGLTPPMSGDQIVPATIPMTHNFMVEVTDNLLSRERSGKEAVAKSKNIADNLNGKVLSGGNDYFDKQGKTQLDGKVRQIAANSYYYQGNVWVENTLKEKKDEELSLKPRHDRVVTIGTPEYSKVVDQLIKEGRQAVLALDGDVNIRLGKEFILLQNTTHN